MTASQYTLATAALTGTSFLLHLLSAGNFLPDEEVWLLGTLFWYLHYWMNLVARMLLLSASVMLGLEIYKPNMISSYISVSATRLKGYLIKMLAVATICIFTRFITPGPVTSFGFLYKLCFMTSLSATVLTVVEDGGANVGSPFKRKLGMKKKEFSEDDNDQEDDAARRDSIALTPTKRQLTAMELLQTETTYLRNLKIIIEIYKQPLEKAVADGEQILAPEDIRNVFGGVSDILVVHEQLHQDLSKVITDWHEDCCIAEIIIKYQEQLTNVYPNYVNYFDMGKDIIEKQKKVLPKFQEFLTNSLNNPTCLKQPLDALLIRPVQRLPSMSLLIGDLQRRTPEDIHDHTELEKAKESLKQVLSHINEDKRKTEGKMKIFDIITEVEYCPVDIVSSNRLFISRINVTSLNSGLYRTGDRLALYLLTDMIEVSKFKRSAGNFMLKHVRMIPLSDIKLVIDINDCEESENMFAIQLVDKPSEKSNIQEYAYRSENMDKMCVCQVMEDQVYKDKFLKQLREQMEKTKEKIIGEDALKKMDASQVQPMLKRGGNRVFRKGRGRPKLD